MKLFTQFYLLFQPKQISTAKAMFQYYKHLCFNPLQQKKNPETSYSVNSFVNIKSKVLESMTRVTCRENPY